MHDTESGTAPLSQKATKPFWTKFKIIALVTTVFLVCVGIALGVYFGAFYNKNKNSGKKLPYVKPPVVAATPQALSSSRRRLVDGEFYSTRRLTGTLDPNEIRDRFFNPSGGPTNLFNLLANVDDRISGINSRLATNFNSCMQRTPTSYTITAWGTTLTFYAQCSEILNGNSGFIQWGFNDDIFYLFERVGDGIVATKVYSNSPNITVTGSNEVYIWYTVGVVNRGGSHAVVQVYANPSTSIFELTTAGVGVGYCGAQLRSYNDTMYVIGSTDMGTCSAIDDVCTSTSNITETVSCPLNSNNFMLPALGRQNYDGSQHASTYPAGGGNVYLQPSGNDDVYFGPTTPTV